MSNILAIKTHVILANLSNMVISGTFSSADRGIDGSGIYQTEDNMGWTSVVHGSAECHYRHPGSLEAFHVAS